MILAPQDLPRSRPFPFSTKDLATQVVSPVVETGWAGHSFLSSDLTPPDVQVAAGPSEILETVNSHLDIYTRTGILIASYSLPSFFAVASDYVTDPQLQYDSHVSRWFVTVGEGTTGQVLMAVSKSSDPRGGWWYYAAPGTPTGNCPDQPILSVSGLNVIVSINWYTNFCQSLTYSYLGAQMWIFNKTDLLNGANFPTAWVSMINSYDFSIHPVKMEGESPVQYMVSTYWPDSALTSTTTIELFEVRGSPPGTVAMSITDISMPLASLAPDVAQGGSSALLDPGDIRIADAVWSRGSLWLAFEEACSSGGTVATACIRLLMIDTATLAIVQDFDLSSPSRSYFYPALALDGMGNLAVVFGYASGLDYPGIMATARLIGDPRGLLQPPVVVKPGTGSETTWCPSGLCRYGDYFGASRDPVDLSTLWFAGEFGQSSEPGWGTYVFSARIKAMLSVNYGIQGGTPPSIGPFIHYTLDGLAETTALGLTATTVLADPGTAWRIDANFTDPSGLVRYIVLPSDRSRLSGTATASMAETVTYHSEYRVVIAAGAGGSVSFTLGRASGTVPSGGSATLYVPLGGVVNLSATPSFLLNTFSSWSGASNASAASISFSVSSPVSVTASFAPNFAFLVGTPVAAAEASIIAAVLLRRRKRTPKIPPSTPPSSLSASPTAPPSAAPPAAPASPPATPAVPPTAPPPPPDEPPRTDGL